VIIYAKDKSIQGQRFVLEDLGSKNGTRLNGVRLGNGLWPLRVKDLLQLDGVGGGSTLTSKVAIVSPSREPGCDVDYLFAQVGVGQRSVDTRPNCGNMLSGVAPFAIEQGLVGARDGTTSVRVFNVNTRSRIDVTVQTPGGRVTYAGSTRIDGVAGTAAPIRLAFLDAPTGQHGVVPPVLVALHHQHLVGLAGLPPRPAGAWRGVHAALAHWHLAGSVAGRASPKSERSWLVERQPTSSPT